MSHRAHGPGCAGYTTACHNHKTRQTHTWRACCASEGPAPSTAAVVISRRAARPCHCACRCLLLHPAQPRHCCGSAACCLTTWWWAWRDAAPARHCTQSRAAWQECKHWLRGAHSPHAAASAATAAVLAGSGPTPGCCCLRAQRLRDRMLQQVTEAQGLRRRPLHCCSRHWRSGGDEADRRVVDGWVVDKRGRCILKTVCTPHTWASAAAGLQATHSSSKAAKAMRSNAPVVYR
jgi:hypothetical protein